MLSNKQIKQFQTLYKNRFGRKISKKEALEKGINLINLVRIIYRPMTETEYQQLQERRRETGDLKP